MVLQPDPATNTQLVHNAVIPESLHWILQKEYTASYTRGSFGKQITQYRRAEGWELRINYLEIWQPTNFLVTTPMSRVVGYLTYVEPITLELREKRRPIFTPVGRTQVFELEPLPVRHYISFPTPCFHLSWHYTGPDHFALKFFDRKLMGRFSDKYEPIFDFSLPGKFKFKVPLETGDASYMGFETRRITGDE